MAGNPAADRAQAGAGVPDGIRTLLFDVLGTVVDEAGSIAAEASASGRLCLLRPPSELLREEGLGRLVELQPVLGFRKAVPFVGEQEVFMVDTRVLEGSHDLLGLGLFHAGVVGALGDQERDDDVSDAGQRGA